MNETPHIQQYLQLRSEFMGDLHAITRNFDLAEEVYQNAAVVVIEQADQSETILDFRVLSPPTSSHEVMGDKLKIQVRFKDGPQAKSGRIWWMHDRAPAGSAPFLHQRIPEDQSAEMKRDPKTGAWTATIALQKGASRVDFFSNHGEVVNGYQHYLSSPYTRVEHSKK